MKETIVKLVCGNDKEKLERENAALKKEIEYLKKDIENRKEEISLITLLQRQVIKSLMI